MQFSTTLKHRNEDRRKHRIFQIENFKLTTHRHRAAPHSGIGAFAPISGLQPLLSLAAQGQFTNLAEGARTSLSARCRTHGNPNSRTGMSAPLHGLALVGALLLSVAAAFAADRPAATLPRTFIITGHGAVGD